MDLSLARSFLRDRLPAGKGGTDEFLNRTLVRALARVWRRHSWKFTETRGQFRTYATYDTGTITTLAALDTAVTFSGTALDADFIGRHLRIGSEQRDYEIKAVGSTTTCTLKEPYEGTAISAGSSAYTIVKKIYRLPADVHHVFAWKETVSGSWLPLITRAQFEKFLTTANSNGQAQYVIEAGYSTAAMYSTGTLALVAGSTAVAGTSTAFDQRMKEQCLIVRGFPFRLKIASVTDATNLVLDEPWPFDAQPLAKYQIAPAGEPLVELYPTHDYDKSIQIWYNRRPPEIVFGDVVAEFDAAYDDLWIDAALNIMGLLPEDVYEKRVGDLAAADGLEHETTYQLGSYGDSVMAGGPRLSANSAPYSWR